MMLYSTLVSYRSWSQTPQLTKASRHPASRLRWKPAEALSGLMGSGKISPTLAREYSGKTFDASSRIGQELIGSPLSNQGLRLNSHKIDLCPTPCQARICRNMGP